MEQLDCGLLYMTDIELMIGQSSTEAERKRAARLENKARLPPRTNVRHLSAAADVYKRQAIRTALSSAASYGEFTAVLLQQGVTCLLYTSRCV